MELLDKHGRCPRMKNEQYKKRRVECPLSVLLVSLKRTAPFSSSRNSRISFPLAVE
jgi:hypothetical protein